MNLTRARKGGALALVAALALGVSACSGGGAPKTEDTAAAEVAAGTPATPSR